MDQNLFTDSNPYLVDHELAVGELLQQMLMQSLAGVHDRCCLGVSITGWECILKQRSTQRLGSTQTLLFLVFLVTSRWCNGIDKSSWSAVHLAVVPSLQ